MKKSIFVETTQILDENFSNQIDESLQLGLELLGTPDNSCVSDNSDDVGMSFEDAFRSLKATQKPTI
ncbi:MAG: hypothetical protein IJ172_08650 [Ruminococcus sp.]|nr:hypothetical protein [Ruminococcus sp.]